MADVAPAAAAGVDSGRVGRWLASHVEGLTLPVEFELVSGGRSNLTYRLTDAGGAVYARAARRWAEYSARRTT
jgi:aminoglycoside phosphotransferase (APT) family kinase protein